MVKTSENDFQTLQHTCIGTFNNPLGPFINLSTHIVFYPPPLGINFLLGGAYVFYGNISSSYSILEGMPFPSHTSLLRQPNVENRLRP
jgi:hypothetical protein